MAVHSQEEQIPKKGIKDNGLLGIWLGLISFTFMFAVFIVSNVYLRGWSPDVFNITLPTGVQDLVNYNVLLLLALGVLTLVAGISYKNRKDGVAFILYALATIAAIGYCVIDWSLIQSYRALGPAAWTAHLIVQSIMEILVLICIVLYLRAFYFKMRNQEKSLNRFIPGATAVWMYTVIMGLFVFIQCDLIEIGQFAEWCGIKLSQFGK
ncbi:MULTISPECIES: hypothetical protein [Aneurinibacillus]|uniref:DUF998 domain-containing protein n=1 Tax=Aneurinibacillus thermoaerophilus TaxID=143495 RepID=A0A1G8CFP5_ANETH|nr:MULTISPECIES: hypothetical protein [Aneurinibacillus]AMA71873.1 hypothetical protein ACH33_02800 [Aneurinibacillus sp. XH2]MED0674149.1 hypothetical protein [Aneurinibacillus thermoaerophilus]MED0680453.1 hypothetical protein [Aneurinibacillus thermoaerophilus]MED0737290.1 hypothetical protein [Aneurinibacillus thermoaerophilus]MED0758619.1 hypothetical protein [Aneurinibacillus thermoaerophilus]